MKYLKRTKVEELRKKYDLLIGWGNGIIEFERKYNPSMYKLDYMINGQGKNVGEIICGCKISGPDVLKGFSGKKVCVIIYPNIEQECLNQIHLLLPEADTIIGRLVDAGVPYNYSSDTEDLIFVRLLETLGISDPVYMDIGVCHPVVRNNTYMLYEQGYTKGYLVEPNPVMVNLCKEYRERNTILSMGACSGEASSLTYVKGTAPGLNHFLREGEVLSEKDECLQIPVKNINAIFEENKIDFLDILDIDTEGMDYELLKELDMDKFRIKVICAEKSESSDKNIFKLLNQKGYVHFMSTRENQIFVRETE